MTIDGYFRRLKNGVHSVLTSLGSAMLPSILVVAFAAFIYLKARHPVALGEQATAGWAGLPTNYVSLEWLAIISSAALLGAVGETVSF
jgi:hypothetical protein